MPSWDPESQKRLSQIHQAVDEGAEIVQRANQARLNCKAGCNSCCQDELTAFDVEAQNILQRYEGKLSGQEAHGEGACAFLDTQGGCRIYEARPYVCRTQGLPLRWFEELDDWEVQEHRDICPLNEEGPKLESIPDEHCWTLGNFEGQLAQLQFESGGPDMLRVPLRDLFAKLSGQSRR